jgi:hypothetical protein
MPGNNLFNSAWQYFEETGCFKLDGTSLTRDQLCDIRRYIEGSVKFPNSDVPHYQFRLSNVELVHSPLSEQILAGSVTEHVVEYGDKLVDLYLVQMGTNYFKNIRLQSVEREKGGAARQQRELEETLLALLKKEDTWCAIRLDKVVFSCASGHSCLSQDFYSNLLENLSCHAETLEEFSLELPYSLQQADFVQFLDRSSRLETLGLELGRPSYDFLQDLCQVAAKHPKLRRLDLRDTQLNASSYYALSTLLDENYRIQIDLPEFVDEALLEEHSKLMSRLSKAGPARFEAERFNHNVLVDIAVESIEKGEKKRFAVLLRQGSELSAIDIDEEEFKKKLCERLPDVYGAHSDYVRRCSSDFQLDLQQPLEVDQSKTVGCYLLEKAFLAKDGESIARLMKAGANPLEHEKSGKILSQLLFADFGDNKCPKWKKPVADYSRKYLNTLIPTGKHPSSLQAVYVILNDIIQYLNDYLINLMDKKEWPSFLQLITGVAFFLKDREQEWAQAFEIVLNVIYVISTKEGFDIKYERMDALYQALGRFRLSLESPSGGLLGRSELHGKLKRLTNKLENAVNTCKAELHNSELVQSLQAGSPAQAEEIKQLKEKVNLGEMQRIQEKEEMDMKFKKQQEEMEVKIKEQEDRAKKREKELKEELGKKMQHTVKKFGLVQQPANPSENSIQNYPANGEGIASFRP